jgi:hypothetical protein
MSNPIYKIHGTATLTDQGREILKNLANSADTILDITYHKGTFPDPPMETVVVHDMTFKYKCVAIGEDGCFVARYSLAELPAP